jgi:hypothetical protein
VVHTLAILGSTLAYSRYLVYQCACHRVLPLLWTLLVTLLLLLLLQDDGFEGVIEGKVESERGCDLLQKKSCYR